MIKLVTFESKLKQNNLTLITKKNCRYFKLLQLRKEKLYINPIEDSTLTKMFLHYRIGK